MIGAFLVIVPNANAVCWWCDETGCHFTTGPCPPPQPPPPQPPEHGHCKHESSDDPSGAAANPGVQVGVMTGGPWVVADVTVGDSGTGAANNPEHAHAKCSTKVNGTGSYSDPDAVSVTADGTGVVFMPPTLISFTAGPNDAVYDCTTVTVDSVNGGSATYYYDDTTGTWTTDMSAAHCALSISVGPATGGL